MKLIRIFLRGLNNLRKRIFATILILDWNKFKELGYILINFIKNRWINIISCTFLGIIIFFFIGNIKILDIIPIFISSIFSFAISMFVLDKFSNIKLINNLRKRIRIFATILGTIWSSSRYEEERSLKFFVYLFLGYYLITSNFREIGITDYTNIYSINMFFSSIKNKPYLSNLVYDLKSPIFKELLSIITNNPMDCETQLKVEKFLQNQASELLKLKQSNVESNIENKNNKVLVSKLIEKKSSLIKAINNYKLKLKLMDDKLSSLKSRIIFNIDTEFYINIMYGRLLTIISNNQLLNNKTYHIDVTIDLGKEMLRKYSLDCYKSIKEFNPNITYINWKQDNQEWIKDNQLQFELGNVLINFMMDSKLINVEVKVLALAEKKSIIVAGSALVELIPKLKTSFSIQALPNRIPMIVPGKPYKLKDNNYLELGGYLLNGEEYFDEIILSNWELSSNSAISDRNDICYMVNKINSVAFKINENVLDFILLNNDEYDFFIKVNYNHPLSFKEKLNLAEKREIESFRSRRYLELNILGLAHIFREVPSFYLPVRLDYRGRLYCITEYLNYQGIELAKGLLEFSVGENVYLSDEIAIKYFKIFGANSFGNKLDKKSFNDRIAWIDNNLEDIINFDNGVLLKKAENKILFLSFCFEFKKYIQALNNKESFFVTNLPIQLDASCNGFQHLSLLVDDLSLSKELNLSESTWSDCPKDFYSFIALKIKKFFVNKLEENKLNPEDKESYQKLAEINIFRTLIKKAVMTTPYNASAYSIVEYFKENFEKKRNPNLINKEISKTNKDSDYYIYKMKSDLTEKPLFFTERDFQNLRKALKFVLFIDYPKLTALSEYLKGIAKVSKILNIPIPWILPNGLVINQQFYDKKTLKVKPFIYTKNLLNLTILDKTQFNHNKQKIALMPNLVHSLDAASLCLVITNYFKQDNNLNFYSIHDCFAVPCTKVSSMIGLLKSAYCIIYSENIYLLGFDSNFRSIIKNLYGEDEVIFNDEKGNIELKNSNITLKYPSIKSVIQQNETTIDVNNSNYLID
uniref:DNA-directed RNA polymerase n=1 Tax=Termitomyces sp. DKA19 TaxID=2727724 RepID=A0A8F1D6D2_9AGAR|nr:RNA polymerase [Termitomyces sp. DKA19]